MSIDGSERGDERESFEDVTFEILKNSRRRAVLRYLDATDGGATKRELAEHVAAVENDKDPSEVSSQERKRVYISLYQFHLPKMVDADVVRIDDGRTVTLAENADRCLQYLAPRPAERKWYRYYLGLSILGILAFVLGTFLDATVVGFGLFLAAFVLVSLFHRRAAATRRSR